MGRVVFWLGNDIGKGNVLPLVDYPVALFDSEYESSWLNTPLAKYIIKAIDKSEHIKDNVIESPVLGAITPRELSCGCKSVLLAAFCTSISDKFLDGSKMGDNCYPVLFEVANKTGRNVKVRVGRLLREPWGDTDEVLFMPTKDMVIGYKACFDYLAMHTNLFYKGVGYGTQG